MLRTRQLAIGVAGLCMTGAAAAQQAAPASAETAASAAGGQEAVQPKIAPLLQLILGRVASELAKDSTSKPNGLFSSLLQKFGLGGKPDASATIERGLAPAVGYTLQQLDPRSFEVIRSLEVGKAPTVLKTGDVFAIHYSTNLPGQIRLENVDPAGRTSDLGTYTVLVDQLNRLPRDQGIRLEGTPGIELLKFYFYPCLPPEAAGKDWEVQ